MAEKKRTAEWEETELAKQDLHFQRHGKYDDNFENIWQIVCENHGINEPLKCVPRRNDVHGELRAIVKQFGYFEEKRIDLTLASSHVQDGFLSLV